MNIKDRDKIVWVDDYKTDFINPASLPAMHEWKYRNIVVKRMTIASIILLFPLSLLYYSVVVMNKASIATNTVFILLFFALCLSIFYGFASQSISHNLKITDKSVTYTIKSFLSEKRYKDKLSNFRGIYILEDERFPTDLLNSEGSVPITVFTVLLYHPKYIGIKFPLYETRLITTAREKAKNYSELLNLPVLDDRGDPVVFEI